MRALLRHGADIESVISASKVENSPIRCAVGSNALHIAALTGNIIMAKLILETQVRAAAPARRRVVSHPAPQHGKQYGLVCKAHPWRAGRCVGVASAAGALGAAHLSWRRRHGTARGHSANQCYGIKDYSMAINLNTILAPSFRVPF